MDISSILPLLMQRKEGGGDMTALINAFSGQKNDHEPHAQATDAFSMGGSDPLALLSMLKGTSGASNPNLNLVNLISTLGKTQKQSKRPRGLKPVKSFIPDEILGKLVKFFQ